MKRLLVVFVVLLTFQAVALASPKNIDFANHEKSFILSRCQKSIKI